MAKPGTFLQNQYRIIRQLGQGGMGTVYEAIDEELSCLVAIKETLAETDEIKGKFRKEASLLANLDHPVLPKVWRHFSEEESQFLVMEFVEGDDMAGLLEKRDGMPFQTAKVLIWADQLLDALEELHSHKPPIIHHDIKPSNLKLKSKDRIVLLDFGLSRGRAGQMPQTVSVYRSKNIHGYTRGYAPKEQILGQGTDARADLYSLAATLWTLLTGEVPPDALERMGEVEDGNADPLRPASEINPQAPQTVAAVLQQAMSLSRDQRYPSATEMRRALRRASKEKEERAAHARIEEHHQAAQLAMNSEEWGKAIEQLQFIQELDPSFRDVELLLRQSQQQQQLSTMYAEGREHLAAGRTPEALESFEQIDSIQGNYKEVPALIEQIRSTIAEQEVEALYTNALKNISEERWAGAIELLQNALKLKPAHAEAKLKLDYARQQQDLANLYQAALKHYEEGGWREALDDLQRIKGIDENYRETSKLIEDCQRRIEEKRIAALKSEADEAIVAAEQSTTDKKPEIDLIGTEAPARLNVPSLKEEGGVQRKKGKSRSKLALSFGVLMVIAVIIVTIITVFNKRQAEAAVEAAEQQYKVGEALLKEARQKHVEAQVVLNPIAIDEKNKIVFGGKEVQLVVRPDSIGGEARLKESKQKFDQAEAAFREAIRLDPNNALAHSSLGDILSFKQKYAEAEAEYREAIRLSPNDANAHLTLGVELARQKKYAEAEAEYREAIRLDPNGYLAHNNLGSALREQKKYDEAEAAYKESIRLNPDYDYAHRNLGDLLASQKNYAKSEKAEAEYKEAIRLNPYDALVHYSLGNLLVYQQNHAEDQARLRPLLQGWPRIAQQKQAEAEAAYRESIRLDPSYASAHYGLGYVLASQRKFDKAIAEYKEAIRLDPDNALYHGTLGSVFLFQKKYAEAEASLRTATGLDPTNPLAHSDLAGALAYQKKYADAESEIREAVRLDPINALHHIRLSTILYFQKKYGEAEAAAGEAVRLEPSNSNHQKLLGMMKARR
jgi:tetratricopeptide (TPR) repeat protein